MYRDDLSAGKLRLEQAQERIAQRQANLTGELRGQLPAKLLERLTALAQRLPRREVQDLDELQAAEAAVSAYEQQLDEIIALAPELEASYNELPSEVPPDAIAVRSEPFMGVELTDEPALRARLPGFIAQLDPQATVWISRRKKLIIKASFRHEGAPFRLCAQPLGEPRLFFARTEYMDVFEMAVATSVRRSTPRLDLRPETWGHGLTKLLRIHQDAQIGDPEIDVRYLINAPQEAAAKLLTRSVCAELLRIARFDLPRLTVGEGLAVLRWHYDVTAAPLAAAVKALGAIRRVDTSVSLLSGGS